MITKIQGEAPFQVLTNNFSISPSQEGYTLQISADGVNYSNLFSVGANVTRLVTGVAANSYYRLLGNNSEVSINWMKTCVTEGGGSGSGTTYTAGEYISIDQDVISVTGITPDLYLTTADTQDFATQADITAATSPIQSQVDDIERVTATALTELHDAILDLSGATEDFATEQYVDDAIEAAMTGSTPDVSLDPAFPRMPFFNLDGGGVDIDQVKSAIFDTYVPDGAEGPVNCSDIWLRNTAFEWLDNNVYDWEDGQVNFIIDPDEKVAYVENLPAGNYIFGLGKVQAGDNYDPEFEINYWSKEEVGWSTYTTEDTSAIWNEPDFDIDYYWRNKFEGNVVLTNNGEWFNWSFPKDVARFEIRIVDFGEENLEINITYKEDPVRPGEDFGQGIINKIVKLTQSDYDDLVNDDLVDPDTFYVIVSGQ